MKPLIISGGFPPAGNDQPVDPDRPDSEFANALADFRRAARVGADHSAEFWNLQHAVIMERIGQRGPVCRKSLSWALATAMMVLGFGLFLLRAPAQPVTDFAGGYDQELLLDVARALDQELPSALEPALLLRDEIERNSYKKPTLD